MRFRPFLLTVLLLLITPVLSLPSSSQSSIQNPSQGPRLTPVDPYDREDENRAKIEKDMAVDFFRTMEIQSSAAAVENILLAAASLGLGTVWLGILYLIKDTSSGSSASPRASSWQSCPWAVQPGRAARRANNRWR